MSRGQPSQARPVVVPVGGANFGSLLRSLQRIGVEAQFSADPDRIRAASHVILPGVGAAAVAMNGLHDLGLVDCLRSLRQPVFGICLGMQLLFEHSEEGDCELLGLLPGRVCRLAPAPSWPHMGWNTVRFTSEPCGLSDTRTSRTGSAVTDTGLAAAAEPDRPSAHVTDHLPVAGPQRPQRHPLLQGLSSEAWFYFVHGYAAPPGPFTLAHTDFGAAFSAIVAREQIYGAQFHPEKSADAGRQLLANFLTL